MMSGRPETKRIYVVSEVSFHHPTCHPGENDVVAAYGRTPGGGQLASLRTSDDRDTEDGLTFPSASRGPSKRSIMPEEPLSAD